MAAVGLAELGSDDRPQHLRPCLRCGHGVIDEDSNGRKLLSCAGLLFLLAMFRSQIRGRGPGEFELWSPAVFRGVTTAEFAHGKMRILRC